MKKKMLFIIATIMAFALFVPSVMAVEVKTEEDFYTAIESGTRVEVKKDFNIKLKEDITVSSQILINASSGVATMTIDLNGHTMSFDGSSAQILAQTKGKLIVNDSAGEGLITNAEASASNSYLIQIYGICEINGGTIENALASKNAIKLSSNTAICTLNDGTIKNSVDKSGRAVSSSNGTFIMNGGKVENEAAGYDGLVPAIDGHKVIMTGGVVESEGTGINGTGLNVEITGGTINAKWFGLHTRYTTIKPAEGKQVNIKAGRAAIIAHSAPSEGKGNKIYGGNFEAPVLMESKYACDPTNIEVHDGVFTHDVSKYVVDGKYAEKVGINYVIKEYSQNVEVTPVDPKEEVKDTTIGLTENEETKDTLKESLDKEIASDPKLQDAVKNNNVIVEVDVTSIKEKELDKKVIDKFAKASLNLIIANYFDISIVVNDDNNNKLGLIPELTKDIELVIVLPKKYINIDKNVNRKYYVIREHDGKVEILKDVKVSEDGKSIVFKSNKFSTYALAYEDEVIQEELPTNPNTSDINLTLLIGTLLIGVTGIVITTKNYLL